MRVVVLGVDPGTARTGWGAVESLDGRMKLLDCGYISTPPGMKPAHRLKIIFDEISAIMRHFSPDEVAIERLYFNTNVKTAMSVSEARGVVMLASVVEGLDLFEYTPLEVKQAITGYGMAEKVQVATMVKALLNLPAVPKPDDTADAIAVAICHINMRESVLR